MQNLTESSVYGIITMIIRMIRMTYGVMSRCVVPEISIHDPFFARLIFSLGPTGADAYFA